MKQSNPELLPEDASVRGAESSVGGQVEEAREQLEALGLDLGATESVRESVEARPKPEQEAEVQPVAEVSNEAAAGIRERLADIASAAQELASVNMEHRLGDFRDMIPIWANFRSHERATREGEIIQNIKDDFAEVQASAGQSGLDIDLAGIKAAVDSLKVPKGASKLFGSVTLLRGMHRSVFTSKAEVLRSEATKLRRSLR